MSIGTQTGLLQVQGWYTDPVPPNWRCLFLHPTFQTCEKPLSFLALAYRTIHPDFPPDKLTHSARVDYGEAVRQSGQFVPTVSKIDNGKHQFNDPLTVIANNLTPAYSAHNAPHFW